MTQLIDASLLWESCITIMLFSLISGDTLKKMDDLWRMGRFSVVGGANTHLDDMLASQYQSITPTIENLPILHNRPMVRTRDRESVTQVVEWNNWTTEILGSDPTGVHALVRLPKACWWYLNDGQNSCPGQGWSRVKFSHTFFFILGISWTRKSRKMTHRKADLL